MQGRENLGHLGCELALNAPGMGLSLVSQAQECAFTSAWYLQLQPQTSGSWKDGERAVKPAQVSMDLLPGWKSKVMSGL